MAETQPWFEQELCYTAAEFRQNTTAYVGAEGVVDSRAGNLKVTTSGAADNSVVVAAGSAFIVGDDDTPDQGTYRVRNDDDVTLQLTAGGGGNPRVDTVVATVHDSEYGGSDNDWVLNVVAGTASASAALTDAGITASAATVPDDSIVLAYVLVDGADTLTHTITAGDILDARNQYAKSGTNPWVSLEASGSTSITSDSDYHQVTLATTVHRDRDTFSVTSSTITVLKNGIYDLSTRSGFPASGTGGTTREVSIKVNPSGAGPFVGGDVAQQTMGPQANAIASPSRLQLTLTAGDIILLCVSQDSTASRNTITDSHLTVRKVG